MTTDAWSPAQYERFQAERARPFFDLLAMVAPEPSMRVVDLGCGTGSLTRAMHERLSATTTLGLDTSDAMLAKARLETSSGLTFERGDIASFGGEAAWDLVFSNAALHWVPDHARLVATLAKSLRRRGQLAVQVPANHDQPSHVAAEEVAREFGIAPHPRHVRAPEEYARILHACGFAEQRVRLEVYAHVLPSREHVVEWVKGTTLTDYEKRLDAKAYAAFVARYRERLFDVVPDERPFLFPFKRILFWGRLGEA